MQSRKVKRSIQSAISSCLLAVLLIGTLQTGAVPLGDTDLARYQGTGFWSDPCTWDGLAAGAGSLFCAFGSVTSCFTAATALFKAYKSDNCF